MKQTLKRLTIISAAGVTLLIPSVAMAHAGHDTNTEARPHTAETLQKLAESSGMPVTTAKDSSVQMFADQIKERIQRAKEELKQKQAANSAARNAKLDDAKKKICSTHQSHINGIMNSMDKRRQATFDHISKIAAEAQDYYTKKQLSVSNYDELVSTVAVAKDAAQAAMDAQTATPNLSCDSLAPRDNLQQFRDKRLTSIDTMKIYRDAVKKLVDAIKTASHSQSKTNNNQSGTHS